MRPIPKYSWLLLALGVALLLPGCGNDSARKSPTEPPIDPPPNVETPPECERSAAVGFDAELATLLAEFADAAYDIDASWTPGEIVGSRGDCWEFVRFIEYVDVEDWVDTQLYLAQNAYTGDIVVAFRGSQQGTDAWTDIAISGVDWTLPNGQVIGDSVHSGFNSGYMSVRDVLRDALLSLVAALDDGSPRVHFTGHSLGGALATLAALDLTETLVQAGVARDDVIMYSFGAPRSISELLTPHFDALVPNAYAVAILRDWVTHVPESLLDGPNDWEHIPNMIVLHGPGARTRLDQGPGSRYDGCIGVPIPLSFAHHAIDLYRSRLGKLGAPVSPVSLSISADGNFVLHWNDEAAGPCDWVGLYHGYPTRADDYLGVFSWDWAEGDTSYKTWWAKGDDYHGAYVNQFGAILSRSQAYVPTKPTVWITKYDGVLADWVQLNWSVSDPGENDFVALYASHPPTAGTSGYMTLMWQWALNGNSYATNTLWGHGYYIAYVMEDDMGTRRILAWSGPN